MLMCVCVCMCKYVYKIYIVYRGLGTSKRCDPSHLRRSQEFKLSQKIDKDSVLRII